MRKLTKNRALWTIEDAVRQAVAAEMTVKEFLTEAALAWEHEQGGQNKADERAWDEAIRGRE